MKIELNKITIRQLVEGYIDEDEGGVTGYGGLLDIRPAYQREFVYADGPRNKVIETVRAGFPLNLMYWVKNDLHTDPTKPKAPFEVLDGQQRTISIARYCIGDFSVNEQYFRSLTPEEREKFLDYELLVYFCEGTTREKLDWFETINIAGLKLTNQELLNAMHTGPWLVSAKKFFSKRNGPAYMMASDYVKGAPDRQEYLEVALKWINAGNVVDYMGKHKDDLDAKPLIDHFTQVLKWVRATFPTYRRMMKGLDWGTLYTEHSSKKLDPVELEAELTRLLSDQDVDTESGVYYYVLTRNEKYLNLRAFPVYVREAVLAAQGGKCAGPTCSEPDKIRSISDMHGDHIKPWSQGGKTVEANCQMLCPDCNLTKGAKFLAPKLKP